ncbi:MAG: hypothetical protein JRF58_00100 [Deltaproteobacteria bacterium]|nr:hypothetical protein [Deltaproteobacteria bacterium]
MKPNRLLYLSQKDVVSVGLTMTEIIETLEVAFREKGRGNTEMPPKPGIHPGGEDNFIHAMPAYIPALNAAGVKWVSGFPGNQKKGLPYITGLLILNDPETGIPISVMDCVWITAVRTGAATALSARHLARPESSVVGVLGCGVQGRTNVEALNTLFPLKRVMAYDVNTEAVRGYADEIGSRLNLEVIPVGILPHWSILTPTGIPMPCRRRPSSVPTTHRSCDNISKWAISRIFLKFMLIWESWSPDKNREERLPQNGP